MGRWKARGKVMIVASCRAEVYLGPRLWTGEPANWNSIARASAEDLDLIHPRFYSIWFHHGGASRAFSLHMAISHTLAFCPRRVAHLCPLGPRVLRPWERQGIQMRSWESPLWYFFTPLTLDLTPTPHPHSSSLTHTQTHTPLYPPDLRFTGKSSGCQEVWTMHFLIQTNAALRSRYYHGATRCFRCLASVECWADREREEGRRSSVGGSWRFMLLGSNAVESLWIFSVEISKQMQQWISK